MKKIAIIVGHNEMSKGACGSLGYEFDFYKNKVVPALERLTEKEAFELKVFYRKYHNSYTTEIKEVYKHVDEWGADASIELHFDAFNSKVSGTSVKCSSSDQSQELANKLYNCLTRTFSRKGSGLRGVEILKKGDRGFRSVYGGKAPAALIEPFFGDNPNECKLVNKIGVEKIAQSILIATRCYLEKTSTLDSGIEKEVEKTTKDPKPLKKSRTIAGAGLAASAGVLQQGKTQLTELAGQVNDATHSAHLSLGISIFASLIGIIGIGLILYARIDDWKKGGK